VNDDLYTVFRRNDGYVSAIASRDCNQAKIRLTAYGKTSFEILLQTRDWAEARERIEQERMGS